MKYSYSPDARWDAKPQYPHKNIIFETELHEFFHELREFDKTSKHFPFGDHFLDSHNLFFITVNPLISPPWTGVGSYLFQTHLRGGGLSEREGTFNLEKTMV